MVVLYLLCLFVLVIFGGRLRLVSLVGCLVGFVWLGFVFMATYVMLGVLLVLFVLLFRFVICSV